MIWQEKSSFIPDDVCNSCNDRLGLRYKILRHRTDQGEQVGLSKRNFILGILISYFQIINGLKSLKNADQCNLTAAEMEAVECTSTPIGYLDACDDEPWLEREGNTPR